MRIPLALLAGILLLFVSPVTTSADTITFAPSQAGFLSNDDPTRNWAPLLESIGVYHFGTAEHLSYLQFDLSNWMGSRAISNIELTLSSNSVSQFLGTPVEIAVYAVPSNAWTTNTITWNNQP